MMIVRGVVLLRSSEGGWVGYSFFFFIGAKEIIQRDTDER